MWRLCQRSWRCNLQTHPVRLFLVGSQTGWLFFILGEALCIAFHDIFPGADGVEQAIIGRYAKIDRINDCICVRIKKYGYGIARVAGAVDDAMYS